MLDLDLQFFAEDDNTDNANTDDTKTKDDVTDKTDTSDKTDKTDTDDKKDQKTFTQAELDEIIAKRIERERKKYSDYDDLKTKASEYEKELEEKRLAELSEKERAEEIARKAQEEKDALEKQLSDYKTKAEQEKINNEFFKLATSANIQFIDDALKLADLSAVTISDEGKVEGIEDVVKTLVENKPFLVATKKEKKQIGDASNSTNDTSDKTADQLLKEAAEKARKSNRIEDKVAYSRLKKELGK